MNQQIIRVRPKSFDCAWLQDLQDVGITLSENMSVMQYTPVNHNPTPFSLEIDLDKRTVVGQIVGVMPNAAYRGHIYKWDEFLALIIHKDGSGLAEEDNT